MKAKLGIKTCEYFVTDDAVICIITPSTSNIDMAHTGTMLFSDFAGIAYPNKIYQNFLKKTFKGIARLKDGDQNNIELAKKIAREKAYRTLCKNYRALLGMLIDKQIQVTHSYLEMLQDLNNKVDGVDDAVAVLTVGET